MKIIEPTFIEKTKSLCPFIFFSFAFLLFTFAVYDWIWTPEAPERLNLVYISLILCFFSTTTGGLMLYGKTLSNVKAGKFFQIDFAPSHPVKDIPDQAVKTLDENVLEQRKQFAQDHQLPGDDGPRFSSINISKASEILVRPSAYPMTPMYLLDNNYRIIDWNDALSLAYDRTMEGRFGHSILEWTYFLDNYEDILKHGEKVFTDENRLPVIDVENIEYTSMRYGKIRAKKRAYQVPDDEGLCLAWLITLDLRFVDVQTEERYKKDLLHKLSKDQVWSEYSFYYDALLKNTKIYDDLIDVMVGVAPGFGRINGSSRVLDLGAGTGNICQALHNANPQGTTIALENNRIMLDILRCKCRDFLVTSDDQAGVIAVKQDITSLYGLADDYFDYVIANNVLYAVKDIDSCLKEIHRVLKPGANLRISGPHAKSDPDRLFKYIRSELKAKGIFAELEEAYRRVYNINKFRLGSLINRFTYEDLQTKLTEVGFVDVHQPDVQVYNGESMLISATKNKSLN